MPLPPDEIRALDRAHVWRPYTSSEAHATREDPVIVGASGAWLRCADGQRLLDATSSWWTAALGYQHPRLVAALQAQAGELAHVALAGATHGPAAELAARLTELAPRSPERRLERVFFSDNGSTSVEVALKVAYQSFAQNGAPQRRRFLSLPGAYHGDTIGAMSVGALDEFGAVFRPLLFGTERAAADAPKGAAGWQAAFDAILEELRTNGERICAVIVEPLVLGAAGMRMYEAEHLRRLRAACDEAGALLIADEVFTGLGRTGRRFAVDHAEVVPDLLCLSKALSGGMLPFGATLATRALFDAFRGDATRALMHGHTYCGNPLGARVALETLQVFEDEQVLEGLAERAAAITECFVSLGREGGLRPRSLGLIGAIDLGDEGYYGDAGWAVHERARRRGVWLRPLGDTVYVVPPLNIDREDLDRLLDVVHGCVRETLRA